MPDPDAVIPGGSSDTFRQLPRRYARLDGLDLYARVLERTGGPIDDPQRIDEALSILRASLVDVTSTTSTLHGWRAQALFEAIVASLGRVRLLKLEDSGDVFFDGDSLKPPDFRIVTSDGKQILVEVKNVFYSDPAKPRRVNADGEAHFTVARAEYLVAGQVVTVPAEQHIMQRLMFYGVWAEETSDEIIDGELISTSFLFSPEEPPPDQQQFAMHRPLSSIYSAMFNEATMNVEGEITALRLDIDPGALASLIPDDYEGETLRIWRFHLQPG